MERRCKCLLYKIKKINNLKITNILSLLFICKVFKISALYDVAIRLRLLWISKHWQFFQLTKDDYQKMTSRTTNEIFSQFNPGLNFGEFSRVELFLQRNKNKCLNNFRAALVSVSFTFKNDYRYSECCLKQASAPTVSF